jgi:DNA repair protein RecN (Recombination protein N)
VEKALIDLKMEETSFEVLLAQNQAGPDRSPYLTVMGQAADASGMDRAAFNISPNKGEVLKPLAAIASGGELSRVVLALKSILASTEAIETVIFDEVDAGIGGGTAEAVGRKISQLAREHQIICITHHAQIAKFGKHHFRISKTRHKGRTVTRMTPLKHNERVEELARMIGGDALTPKSVAHAKEMLAKI